MVGQEIGVVALKGFSLAVDIEGRVEVGSLAGETDPVVEAFAGGVVLVAHMPLPDVTGAVPCLPEVFGKEAGAGRHGSLVVHYSVVAHILTGKDGGSAGRAKGGGHESVGKMGPLAGDPVEVWGLEKLRGFLHEAHEVVAVVVAQNEQDVARFRE